MNPDFPTLNLQNKLFHGFNILSVVMAFHLNFSKWLKLPLLIGNF